MIEVKNLVKDYGGRLAVDHLSFTIRDGEIIGFLGPNGAGKSTTMNIMTGYLGATDGEVLIDGKNILEEPDEARRLIGYLPEIPPLYLDMTVLEYLSFAAELKKIPKKDREEAVSKAMELTMLNDVKGRLIKNLSKGYRQRVGLAQAVLGMPPVIILDEPTVGLDPKQIIEIRDLIKSLGKKHTVILSSHILSEVSAVCDHILIISHGRLAANGTPESLESQMAGAQTVVMTVKGSPDAVSSALSSVDGIASIETSEPEIKYEMKPEIRSEMEPEMESEMESETEQAENQEADKASDRSCLTSLRLSLSPSQNPDRDSVRVREDIFYALSENRLPILSMQLEKTSLEQVFLELTQSGQQQPEQGEETAGRGRAGKHVSEKRYWRPSRHHGNVSGSLPAEGGSVHLHGEDPALTSGATEQAGSDIPDSSLSSVSKTSSPEQEDSNGSDL